jgi:hypothetical protein
LKTSCDNAVLRWREALLLVLAFVLIAAQLFVRPVIGLADNGDFPKVSGILSPGTLSPIYFTHCISSYFYSPAFYRTPDTFSSEMLLGWVARTLVRADRLNARFGIVYLGAVHTVIFLGGYIVLRLLRRITVLPVQIASALLFLWIFTDVAYVAYFNSFYTDTIAILMLPVLVACALFVVAEPKLLAPLVVFFVAAVLLVTSRSQHSLLGIFPLLFLMVLASSTVSLARKTFLISASFVLLAAMV